MVSSKKPPWVDVESQSLDEWLSNLALPEKKRTPLFAGFRFPTNRHREEYIASIKDRTDNEIRFLLRHFLLEGGSLGIDQGRHMDYISRANFRELLESSEYVRRLINRKLQTWEGMTWIIDLLPHHPATAIAAIEAYNIAHYYLLPDGRCDGLSDAVAVIRAKYIEAITEDNLAETVGPATSNSWLPRSI
jgi:restriction system protein